MTPRRPDPPKAPRTEAEPEIVPVPDTLRRKALVLRGSLEDAMAEAVGRAESAVERLSVDFERWMGESAARLAAAHAAYRSSPGPDARAALFKAAHDLRGRAGMLGYPLAGRIGASLARLLGDRSEPPADLVAQHVDAVRAMVRQGAKDASDPVGSALAAELERAVDAVARRPGPR